jgi:hypothetical protein
MDTKYVNLNMTGFPKDQFLFLPVNDFPEKLSKFSLDTLLMEEEMRTRNGGIELASLKAGHKIVDEEHMLKFVPHFDNHGLDRTDVNEAKTLYRDIETPCSMLIENREELKRHIMVVYQVMYYHYVLGKKHNIKGSFPHSCCGYSASAITRALLAFGYANAVKAASSKHDHAYDILPFVIPEEKVRGCLLLDPTYDQLWKRENTNKRNMIFIKIGTEWAYRTGWKGGTSMFPDKITYLQPYGSYTTTIYSETIDFLKKAFTNPIRLNKNSAS